MTLIKFRISEHQKAEQAKADAKRIAEEQEAERLASIKPEPVVEKVATPEPVRAAAPVGHATKPVASHAVEQVALQANVTDFEALIKAVANGQAPITLLLVNWEALDAMVAAQNSKFSMAGVTLGKAAA